MLRDDAKSLVQLPPRELTPPVNLTEVLGTWFGVLPLSLKDVCGVLPADVDPVEVTSHLFGNYEQALTLPMAPFKVTEKDCQEEVDSALAKLDETADSHNESVEERTSSYALETATDCSMLGGVCGNQSDFAGVVRRYVTELLPDIVVKSSNSYSSYPSRDLVQSELGLVSKHRAMRKTNKGVVPSLEEMRLVHVRTIDPLGRSMLSLEDYAVAAICLADSAQTVHSKTGSLNGVMDHLQNLGHAVAPLVEGLTVELLPFQRQTLQWAAEREQTPGGVNSFLWPKLPSVAQPNKELYFNPILGELTDTKPNLVRGGFISEQMGLGECGSRCCRRLYVPGPGFSLQMSNSLSS